MGYARGFEEITMEDVALAGGKGASLGEMTKAGIPVPGGFVILSNAFDSFTEDLAAEIDASLDRVHHDDVNSAEEASETIRALIMEREMPSDIERELRARFETLGARFVAVRSSATAEDSKTAAWAGQLESYLNTTAESLAENVRRCWASLFTPRAIVYRLDKKLHKARVSVAVVVQEMVESEVAGVAFSVHPVTEDREQLIIEAGLGLGEAVVAGEITPDSYIVRKDDWSVVEKHVSAQQRKLVRKGDGGNEWVDLGREGGEQKLADERVEELAKMVVRIEKHYGFPVDIEWAIAGGRLSILQSRPITTLKGTG